MSNFCITLPLITEIYQEDILYKRFEIARKMYNSLVTITKKRYKEMIKSKLYKHIRRELRKLKGIKDKVKLKYQKELYKKLNEIYKKYRFSEYDFHADIKLIQHKFKLNIDSNTSQKIASHLWKAYDKLFFGNGKHINYKKYESLNSLEGKSNKAGIRLKNNKIYWLGLELPIKINDKNNYEKYALEQPICYNRIIRKFIRGKYKYYIQIIFKGKPFIKYEMNYGDVGLDIGTQTIAICSNYEVKLYELADKVAKLENQKNILQRKMDRSKRVTNKDNFKEDGTIKKGVKLEWNYSKNYIKNKNLLKEIYRKQTAIRKIQHEILANKILTLGSNIYVEQMNFQGLQRRSKETTKNKNGKINRKKRFGKSLGNKAPAMLLEILDRKLKYHGEELHKVNTYKIKASQYNHEEDTYKKKKLSQRWTIIGENKVQRDLYSSFLLMNVNKDLETINKEKCNNRFDNFIKKHNQEIKRLKKQKNLSSVGI